MGQADENRGNHKIAQQQTISHHSTLTVYSSFFFFFSKKSAGRMLSSSRRAWQTVNRSAKQNQESRELTRAGNGLRRRKLPVPTGAGALETQEKVVDKLCLAARLLLQVEQAAARNKAAHGCGEMQRVVWVRG